jgi:hypothetical protein
VSSLLRIGGVTIAVDPPVVFPEPLARFAVRDTTAPADLRVSVAAMERYEPPRGELLFDSGEVWRLYDDDGGALRIECRSEMFGGEPYKIARVDRAITRCEILTRQPSLQPLEFPLDELLINALLSRRRGVELHACGVIDRNGDGYVFAGNSGDGKTTSARLWMDAGAEVVSDDRVVVREEGGAWRMYGTPWHGEAEICSPGSAPLRRVFLLDKAKPNAAAPLETGEAVARLLSCAFPPFHDPGALLRLLETLGALASAVPVSRLSFVNDESAVALVRSL